MCDGSFGRKIRGEDQTLAMMAVHAAMSKTGLYRRNKNKGGAQQPGQSVQAPALPRRAPMQPAVAPGRAAIIAPTLVGR